MNLLRLWLTAMPRPGRQWVTVTTAMIVAGAPACDRYVVVDGVVRDPSGGPLREVVVTMQTPGRMSYANNTDANGRFHVGMVGVETRLTRIAFEKYGFTVVERTLDGQPDRSTMEIQLVPTAPASNP